MSNEERLVVHVDWLSFTFPIKHDDFIDFFEASNKYLQEIMELLGFEEIDCEPAQYAFHNYKYEYILGEHVRVRLGGETTRMKQEVIDENGVISVDMVETCQLEISGQGCREIEAKGRVDYLELINYFTVKNEGRARRIDIAIDDTFGNIITLEKIEWYLRKGWYVSPFKKFTPHGMLETGLTLELGSRDSGCLLRIYDKKAERRSHKDSYGGEYWVRYEIQFNNEKAEACCDHIYANEFSDIGEFAKGYLFNLLDLKTKTGKDTNISRWKTARCWRLFLDDVVKAKFSMKGKETATLERKKAWYDYSITKMNTQFDLVNLFKSNADDAWFDPAYAKISHELKKEYDLLSSPNFKDRDLKVIQAYQEKQGIPKMTWNDVENKKRELKERLIYFEKFKLPF